jgi:hypothetical protein
MILKFHIRVKDIMDSFRLIFFDFLTVLVVKKYIFNTL